jgi:tetratricopeptide (TPR) repeat protein
LKINQIAILFYFISYCFSQDNGLEYYQNQEYEEAKDYYETIILERGDNAQAHFGHGASSFQQGDMEVAKQGFQESLKSSDSDLRSKAYYNLGNTFYKNNKTEEALSFYRKALELNPNDKEAIFNYEYLKYQKKPPEEDNKQQEKKEEEQEKKEEEQEKKEEEQEKKEEEQEKKEEEQEKKEEEQEKKEEEQEKKEEEQEKKEEEQEKKEEEQEKKEASNEEKDQEKKEASNEEKDQDLKQAESILDALKQDEKIMQKKQISRSKSRKLAKDW